jgi:TetR/AcrR family transcriptional regulator
MPKPTFFNLPPEKREAITNIAIDEFAECEFNEVSISRIVGRAGIAKGSFYQYFEDKKDVFFYLLDLAGKQKLDFLKSRQPPDPQMGMFAYIKYLVETGLEFQFVQPRLNMVAYRALYGTLPFRDETLQRFKEAASDFYRQLVDMGIAQGDISPQVNREAAAFVLAAVFNDFGNYFFRKINVDPHILVERQFSVEEQQGMRDAMNEVMEVLKSGLGCHA